MTPREAVTSVPYAMVSRDATGDINPTSVTINGLQGSDQRRGRLGRTDDGARRIDGGHRAGRCDGRGTGAAGASGDRRSDGRRREPTARRGRRATSARRDRRGFSGRRARRGCSARRGRQGLVRPGQGRRETDRERGSHRADRSAEATGATGTRGATGPYGSVGTAGPTGCAGATGNSGRDGDPPSDWRRNSGATGPTGPAGLSVTGSTGGHGIGRHGAEGTQGCHGRPARRARRAPRVQTGLRPIVQIDGATGPSVAPPAPPGGSFPTPGDAATDAGAVSAAAQRSVYVTGEQAYVHGDCGARAGSGYQRLGATTVPLRIPERNGQWGVPRRSPTRSGTAAAGKYRCLRGSGTAPRSSAARAKACRRGPREQA